MQPGEFKKLIQSPWLLNTETINPLKALVEEYPFFQAAWMLYLKNLKQIKSPEFDSVLKEAAIRIPDRKLMFQFLNTDFQEKGAEFDLERSLNSTYNLDEGTENQSGDSLIDKFLSSESGVIRTNTEDGDSHLTQSISEAVESSAIENDEIITEPLANIYFQQKNYDKALDAYKKLSLKYPEKSVYFASRIEEIENLKNI